MRGGTVRRPAGGHAAAGRREVRRSPLAATDAAVCTLQLPATAGRWRGPPSDAGRAQDAGSRRRWPRSRSADGLHDLTGEVAVPSAGQRVGCGAAATTPLASIACLLLLQVLAAPGCCFRSLARPAWLRASSACVHGTWRSWSECMALKWGAARVSSPRKLHFSCSPAPRGPSAPVSCHARLKRPSQSHSSVAPASQHCRGTRKQRPSPRRQSTHRATIRRNLQTSVHAERTAARGLSQNTPSTPEPRETPLGAAGTESPGRTRRCRLLRTSLRPA
jgi:hypothetical protein